MNAAVLDGVRSRRCSRESSACRGAGGAAHCRRRRRSTRSTGAAMTLPRRPAAAAHTSPPSMSCVPRLYRPLSGGLLAVVAQRPQICSALGVYCAQISCVEFVFGQPAELRLFCLSFCEFLDSFEFLYIFMHSVLLYTHRAEQICGRCATTAKRPPESGRYRRGTVTHDMDEGEVCGGYRPERQCHGGTGGTC